MVKRYPFKGEVPPDPSLKQKHYRFFARMSLGELMPDDKYGKRYRKDQKPAQEETADESAVSEPTEA